MNGYIEIINHLHKNKYRWLITGVAGFIGSNLCEKLIECNQDIIGIDNLSSGKIENVEELKDKILKNNYNSSFKFIKADICDLKVCFDVVKNIDFVLHQAARGSVIKSIEDPISTNQSNITGFTNIIHASSNEKVKKFIFASSSSVYGDNNDLPKKEMNIGNQLSPYAVTKYVNELYARVFSLNYGLKTVGLRYFNVFGKNQNPSGDYAAVIPKWLYSMIESKDIEIYGDGTTSRDFCYIDNVVQMNILSALTNLDNNFELFNVACNSRTSLKELIELINFALKENNFNEKNAYKIVHKDFRKGDIMHSLADITKANKILKYSPEYSIKYGLIEYVRWYLSKYKKEILI